MAYRLSAPTHSRKYLAWIFGFIGIVAITGAAFAGYRYYYKSEPSSAPRSAHLATDATTDAIVAHSITGRYLLNGTVTWARAVEKYAAGNYEQPFSQLGTFNREQYDAWSTDFECPITNNVVPYQTQIDQLIFNCRPEFLPAASKYFNIFDLANNHTDNQHGEVGLAETRKHLDEAGVQYFGTFDPADSANVCEVIALPVHIQKTVTATKESGTPESAALPVAFCGWHYFYRKPLAGEIAIMDAYSKVMPVITFAEMGAEYHAKADDIQTSIAHQIIDQGADFLIANNPHWVQNTEVYNKKLIVYSTGNFIFDQLDTETNRSASIDVSLTVPYDANLAAWLALAPTCKTYHDNCLAEAQKRGLQKVIPTYTFGIVAGQNGSRVTTHKADTATQTAVEARTNWAATLQALGQK